MRVIPHLLRVSCEINDRVYSIRAYKLYNAVILVCMTSDLVCQCDV